jgi:uncharacterized membrane protein YsdA (DUF1294 family)
MKTMNLVVLIGLLVLPAIALQRSGVNLLWVGAYAILISVLTYWTYARDKRRAENGEWRVPEMRLHLLELIGGWSAAFLAQRRLRHKCSKRSYQIVFWLIVLVWQFVAVDSLQNWKHSRPALNWLEQVSEHRK